MATTSFSSQELNEITALNTAEVPHVNQLSCDEMSELIQIADYVDARFDQADTLQGLAIGFKHSNNSYPGFNFNWFKQRFENFLYIDRIIVAPSARGQKLGSQLYQSAEQWCKEQSLNSIVCEVNREPANPVSHQFHQSVGFQAVEDIKHPEGKTVAMYRWPLLSTNN